jgi:hypothetical protein
MAICSVDRTINTAIGTMANAAEKKITGRHLAGMLENQGDRNENKEPMDGRLHGIRFA